MISLAVAGAMLALILLADVTIYRSFTAADDYSYQSNEQLRCVDFICRDIRGALSVTIPQGGQTLSLTLPDCYSSYDAVGNPIGAMVTPTISNGSAQYGDSTKPIAVTYYVSGNTLVRQQQIASKNLTSQMVVASNLNNFQLNFLPNNTIVNFTLTFAPRQGPASAAIQQGTTVRGSVSARNLRVK
jgi:hypothetical protein